MTDQAQEVDSSALHAILDYSDDKLYVEPLIRSALQKHIPSIKFISSASNLPLSDTPLLTWSAYESLDFESLVSHTSTRLFNAYIIRKALIRKHYLQSTAQSHVSKHPATCLKDAIPLSVAFEVDYAEFLDESLVEEYELLESMQRNEEEGVNREDREYWILKPGMSDRGMGIRLFSTMEELQEIFESFEEEESDPEDEDTTQDEDPQDDNAEGNDSDTGIITSQLRHFVAQRYVEPLLLTPLTSGSLPKKFHIRTYILAIGGIKVYVYKPMLALFSSQAYTPFHSSSSSNEDLSAHLTNTCLQSGVHDGSVIPFWSLSKTHKVEEDELEEVFTSICDITGELFKAAIGSGRIHFQPLPNAFEIYGLDFLVGHDKKVKLLEVNAFPDFKQTGDELKGLVEGLFEGVVEIGVKGFFNMGTQELKHDSMIQVLDLDIGKF